jgi:hypothetical protein
MKRWFVSRSPYLHALALGALLAALSHGVAAQSQPKRAFPTHAMRAHMVVVNAHEVTLNGTLTRLAPGSRIRTESNAMVVSGGLVGQGFVVNYTRDSLGQAHEIWLLNAAEAADRRPGSEGMASSNIVSDTATSLKKE